MGAELGGTDVIGIGRGCPVHLDVQEQVVEVAASPVEPSKDLLRVALLCFPLSLLLMALKIRQDIGGEDGRNHLVLVFCDAALRPGPVEGLPVPSHGPGGRTVVQPVELVKQVIHVCLDIPVEAIAQVVVQAGDEGRHPRLRGESFHAHPVQPGDILPELVQMGLRQPSPDQHALVVVVEEQVVAQTGPTLDDRLELPRGRTRTQRMDRIEVDRCEHRHQVGMNTSDRQRRERRVRIDQESEENVRVLRRNPFRHTVVEMHHRAGDHRLEEVLISDAQIQRDRLRCLVVHGAVRDTQRDAGTTGVFLQLLPDLTDHGLERLLGGIRGQISPPPSFLQSERLIGKPMLPVLLRQVPIQCMSRRDIRLRRPHALVPAVTLLRLLSGLSTHHPRVPDPPDREIGGLDDVKILRHL